MKNKSKSTPALEMEEGTEKIKWHKNKYNFESMISSKERESSKDYSEL